MLCLLAGVHTWVNGWVLGAYEVAIIELSSPYAF